MIIAAGGGRRIGGPEALLHQGGKRALVSQMIDTMGEAGCEQIVVVLGAAAEQVRQTTDLGGATVVVNRAWGTGLGSSIRAGLAALTDEEIEAVVVVPVDMPGLFATAVRRVAALPYPDVLVCATYEAWAARLPDALRPPAGTGPASPRWPAPTSAPGRTCWRTRTRSSTSPATRWPTAAGSTAPN